MNKSIIEKLLDRGTSFSVSVGHDNVFLNPYLSIAGYLAGTIDFNEFLLMMTSKMVSLSSYMC